MAILKKALISNAMFSDLDEEQINDICECMEDMSYKKSDVVFRLGESHPCKRDGREVEVSTRSLSCRW